jgi:hypothetical protein
MPFFVIPKHQRKESFREKSLVGDSGDDEGGQDQVGPLTPCDNHSCNHRQVKEKTPVEGPCHAFSMHV